MLHKQSQEKGSMGRWVDGRDLFRARVSVVAAWWARKQCQHKVRVS